MNKIYSKLGVVELFTYLKIYELNNNEYNFERVMNVVFKIGSKLSKEFGITDELKKTTIGKDLWNKCIVIPFRKSTDEIREEYKKVILYCTLKSVLLNTSENLSQAI